MPDYAGITTSHTKKADWAPLMEKTKPVGYQIAKEAVNDPDWQKVRLAMKGIPLGERYAILKKWGDAHNWDDKHAIQVRNYITALFRGGMVK